MKTAELAKLYIRRIISSPDPVEMGKRIASDVNRLRNRNERILHVGALHIVSDAMRNLLKKSNQDIPSEKIAKASDEIDRMEAIITSGWQKKGPHYIKEFDTPSDLIDALVILKSYKLVSNLQPPTDSITTLVLSEKSHQYLLLLLEGRSSEICK